MSKSSEPHLFQPNPGKGKWDGYYNHQECGYCRMPRTHEVHPQAQRGALGHHGDDNYAECWDATHWSQPVISNEGAMG
jgi:hypothetical protein